MTKPLPDVLPLPLSLTIHKNGPNRKRKVMIQTPQGIFSARRYYYALYHPDWNRKGKVIHLNNDDLDFSPDNLVLLSERECNNLVHFNNDLLSNNPNLQKAAISLIRLRILLKEVKKNEERY
jgi:hypothetical protein